MKAILVKFEDEQVQIPITKDLRWSSTGNDYKLAHDRFKYFQFDQKPQTHSNEYMKTTWFNGYLIGKRKGGEREIVDCQIKCIF
jgi:hypothetical protein